MPHDTTCFLHASDLFYPHALKSPDEQRADLKQKLRNVILREKDIDSRVNNKNLAFIMWPGVTFSGMDFQGFKFNNSDFSGGQFIGCDLRGVDFTQANLSGVTFHGCMISANCLQTQWVSLLGGQMPRVANFSQAYMIDQAWYGSLRYLFAENKGLQQKNEGSLRRLLKPRQALYQMLRTFFINDLSLMVLEYVFTVCHCHRNDMQKPLEKESSPLEIESSCMIL